MKIYFNLFLTNIFLFFTINSLASEPMQAGEAYVTRFSGVTKNQTLDAYGTVGSIMDIRKPGLPPRGQHWIDEPQRNHIKALDVGQIFGIAIDDNDSPTVYVAATARFGLHRTKDNGDWVPGMWGKGGGPGSIYRLRAENDYQPELFVDVMVGERKNTGASLGNIAYDKVHKQLFVSDLETGMIHRIRIEDGKALGHFDHGETARPKLSLSKVSFDESTAANIHNCISKFDKSPNCWNLAAPERRVWGLGVYQPQKGKMRLYYAVSENGEDKQSSVFSVGIDQNGAFKANDIKKEFMLPKNSEENMLLVSDLAFSNQGEMLVAENGELRNLGLDVGTPFSKPHAGRLFLYKQDSSGKWILKGRYNIGGLNSSLKAAKATFTSAAGGTDFGYGYTNAFQIDLSKRDEFVWSTGDTLCSPKGPCFDVNKDDFSDEDEVHGIQGNPKTAFVTTDDAKQDAFFIESYMIDTDINVDANGNKILNEAKKNDATKIGDVEIAKNTPVSMALDTPLTYHDTRVSLFHCRYISSLHHRYTSMPYHKRRWSHSRWGSHQKYYSHYRKGSHNILRSHSRYGSHYRLDSHYRLWSHDRKYSHRKYQSHSRKASHRKEGSHNRKASHLKYGSTGHNTKRSHTKKGSHSRTQSHVKYGSTGHNTKQSHTKKGSHSRTSSHVKYGSSIHNAKQSHSRKGSHSRTSSHVKYGSSIHNSKQSHSRKGSHSRTHSHYKKGSSNHNAKKSHSRKGSHSRTKSHYKKGSNSHSSSQSHAKKGSHSRVVSVYKKKKTTPKKQTAPKDIYY